MKTTLVFCLLAYLIVALPYEDQMALTNSLIVGRDDQSDLIDWTCKVCDASNKPIHAHIVEEKAVDIKCIVSVYPTFIVLAFRYTNTALNVWQDILYPLQIKDQHTCDKCKVQKAYNNMWEKIKLDVFRDLREIKLQTKLDYLIITGISLGGGLAVISFIDINHEAIFKTVKVITFGAPRVGNKYWAAFFDLITLTRTKRYIVSGDPIVVMPRCLTLLCTYRQTGIKIVCYEDKQVCQQEAEIPDDDDEVQIVKHLTRDIMQAEPGTELQSIMDHVDGYPKIYNFTLLIN